MFNTQRCFYCTASSSHVLQELNAFASQRLDIELDDDAQPAFRNAFTARQPSDAGARFQAAPQSAAQQPPAVPAVSATPVLSSTSSFANAPAPQSPSARPQTSEVSKPDISSDGGDAAVVVESQRSDGGFSLEDRLPQQAGLVKGLSDTPWLSQGDKQAVVSEHSNGRQKSFGASSFSNGDVSTQQQEQEPQGRAFSQQPLPSDRAFAEPAAALGAGREAVFVSQSQTPFAESASQNPQQQQQEQRQQQQVPETAFAASAGRAFSVEPQATDPAPAAPVPNTAYQVLSLVDAPNDYCQAEFKAYNAAFALRFDIQQLHCRYHSGSRRCS